VRVSTTAGFDLRGHRLTHWPQKELSMKNATVGQRAKGPAAVISTPIELLRAHHIFGQLPAPVIKQLAGYVTTRRVQRGAAIFAKGDPGNGLMAVVRGSVRISLPTMDGREVVLDHIRPGEVFGEMALLDGQPRSADATASEDCELAVIDRRNFIQFVQHQPEVAAKLLEVLCGRLRHTNEQVEDVMFTSLAVRLAKLLLRFSSTGGVNGAGKRLTITQRELSQMIGVARESTNKQLRVWEKRGWVRLEHGTLVILNGRALSRIAEDNDLDRDSLADSANDTMIADRRPISVPVAPTSTRKSLRNLPGCVGHRPQLGKL
jgi:CRP/FNR family transcriptional regulator, cyclic AMP receptor protein